MCSYRKVKVGQLYRICPNMRSGCENANPPNVLRFSCRRGAAKTAKMHTISRALGRSAASACWTAHRAYVYKRCLSRASERLTLPSYCRDLFNLICQISTGAHRIGRFICSEAAPLCTKQEARANRAEIRRYQSAWHIHRHWSSPGLKL